MNLFGNSTNDIERPSDDPTTTPAPDPTVFAVGAVIPTLSLAGLLGLFGLLIAAAGRAFRKRR